MCVYIYTCWSGLGLTRSLYIYMLLMGDLETCKLSEVPWYVCIYIYIYMCVCVCVYIYVYVYIYIYIYI